MNNTRSIQSLIRKAIPYHLCFALMLTWLLIGSISHGFAQDQNANSECNGTPPLKAAYCIDKNILTIAIDRDNPPLSQMTSFGEPAGFLVDYWQAWAKKTGQVIRFRMSDWAGTVTAVQQGKADIHSGLFLNRQRQEFLDFSMPFYQLNCSFYHLQNTMLPENPADFGRRRIGVTIGSYQESALRRDYPYLNLVGFPNGQAALKALKSGTVDGVMGVDLTMELLLAELGWDREIKAVSTPLFSNVLYGAVGKGNEALLTGINDGMALLTMEDKIALENLWITNPERRVFVVSSDRNASRLRLSLQELAWLEAHPDLHLGVDSAWPPYDFVDAQGKHSGLAADVLARVSHSLGIRTKLQSDLPWSEVLGRAKNRSLDLVSLCVPTPELAEYLRFSDSVFKSSWVIATRKGFKPEHGVKSLYGKKVLVAEGYAVISTLHTTFSKLAFIEVATPLEALDMVSRGQADAYIGYNDPINYFIQSHALSNLHVTTTPTGFPATPLSICVRSDWPELVALINRALKNISEPELQAMVDRWQFPEMETSLVDVDAPGKVSKGAGLDVPEPPQQDEFPLRWLIVAVILVFSLLLLAALALPRLFSDEDMARHFGSRRFRLIALIVLSLMIVLVAALVWRTLDQSKKSVLKDTRNNLAVVLQGVEERIDFWIREHETCMVRLGSDPELVTLTRQLLEIPTDAETLRLSQPLSQARRFIEKREPEFGKSGFCIINRDAVNIGSGWDNHLGEKNHIAGQKPDLLARAFQGEAVFISPIRSDLMINAQCNGSDVFTGERDKPLALFLAVPIRDSDGTVLAVLAQRLLFKGRLSLIMQSGRIGQSGESYLINQQGTLVSESRFKDQFSGIELLKNQAEIEARDPGGNLLEGFIPEMSPSEFPLTRMAESVIQISHDPELKDVGDGYSDLVFAVDDNGYRDYRGVPVFGAWLWADQLGLGMATEINVDEALAGYHSLRLSLLIITGATLLLAISALLLTLVLGERATRAMRRSRDELEERVEERTRELQLSEEHAQTLLDGISGSGEGMVTIDQDFRIRYMNSVMIDWFGDQTGNPCYRSFMGMEHPCPNCRMDDVVEKGKTVSYQSTTLDGRILDTVATRILNHDGTISKMSMLRDISTRIKEQQALDETREQLTLALEAGNLGYWDWYPQSGVLQTNDIFLTMLGHAPADFPQTVKRWSGLVHPDDLKPTLAVLQPFLDGDDSYYRSEHRMRNIDGQWQWILDAGRVVARDDKGQATRFIGVHIDITESKKANAQLRKLSRAVEQSHSTIVITDIDANIEFVNPAFTRSTGYTKKEALGQNPRVLKSDLQSETFYQSMWKTLTTGEVWQGEIHNRRKDGSCYWEFATISPVKDKDGKTTHYVAVKEDVTLRKETEQKLIKAQEQAEAASQAKSDFLANMSHEIRTPMNAIIGMNYLALQTDLTNRQRDYINKAHSAADSLLGIINDILDFSKIEAGKLEIEIIPFQLDMVLDNLVSLMSDKVQEKGLELSFFSHPGIPDNLTGDPLRLGQILLNIVSNAIKFTDKGEIIVRVELVEREENQATLQFSISDSGIGMSEEQQDKLFQSFSQADSSTTRQFGGTGLGLSISKQLIEMMGGEIRVESQTGEGTTFILTAQFTLGDAVQHSTEFNAEVSGDQLAAIRGARILLVEDNKMNQQVAQELLEMAQFNVKIADNGLQGVEAVKRESFDAVLMDIHMPLMDGYTATSEICKNPQFKDLPIIAMTANAMSGDREKCLQAGMKDHIAKPIDVKKLYAVLARWIKPAERIIPVSVAMESEGEAIPEIPGIDTKTPLQRLNGQAALYRKMLIRFITNHGTAVEEIRQALQADDMEKGIRLAHTLKGMAGTIGAETLQTMALSLEIALKEEREKEYESLIEDVDRCFRETVNSIKNVFEPATAAKKVNIISDQELMSELKSIGARIDDFDSTVEEGVAALLNRVDDPQVCAVLEQMRHHLSQYDFDGAAALLPQIYAEKRR